MSSSDRIREKNEYDTFIKACDYCESHSVNKRTQSIMRFLNGRRINRAKNDRPDIITTSSKGGKEYTIGIEMFYIDQNSKSKRGRYSSKSRENKKQLIKVYDKGHAELVETGQVSEANQMELLQKAVKSAQERLNSSYYELLSAFRYSFENHAKNTDDYRKELLSISDGKEIILAFFMEIECNFHSLFLNEGNTVTEYNSKLMPFFSEFIRIITENKSVKDIDFLVFYLTSYDQPEEKVVAVRTGNIRKNLQNQGITVFEYVGDSCGKADISKTEYAIAENGDYVSRLYFKADFDESNEEIQRLFHRALSLKKHNRPFVATRPIQAMLYASKARTIQEADTLHEKFLALYPVKEIKDDED